MWGNPKLRGFYRVNVTYLGEPGRLADRYNNLVGQLSFGLGYQLHFDTPPNSKFPDSSM
jgi:hypothetical protein